jgi:hypothetical protein
MMSYLRQAYQSPNAVANHSGIDNVVTSNAFGLYLMAIQLIQEA